MQVILLLMVGAMPSEALQGRERRGRRQPKQWWALRRGQRHALQHQLPLLLLLLLLRLGMLVVLCQRLRMRHQLWLASAPAGCSYHHPSPCQWTSSH